jgi:hypothetical protein
MCTLENFQKCAEPCFAHAAILRGGCLPLIPSRHRTDPIENSVVACGFIAVGTSLFAEALLSNGSCMLLVSQSLSSNGSACYNIIFVGLVTSSVIDCTTQAHKTLFRLVCKVAGGVPSGPAVQWHNNKYQGHVPPLNMFEASSFHLSSPSRSYGSSAS